MKEKDIESLQHTTWRCQYHVVFAPKCRRMVIYGQIKKDIGQILRKLCEQKGVEIIEAQACPDHIHRHTKAGTIHRPVSGGLIPAVLLFHYFLCDCPLCTPMAPQGAGKANR